MDGFALNIGKEIWQIDRIRDCFQAALLLGLSSFKLFISFDMSSLPSSKSEDVIELRNILSEVASHANYLKIDGKAVVSTFAGENSLFGQINLNAAWAYVKGVLNEVVPINLVPSFFIEPARYQNLNAADGIFNWNGCWPVHLNDESPWEEVHNAKLDSDFEYLRHIGGKFYMASVSPWFFTHYGPDTWNKNWIYRGDDWLFVRRWEQLVAMRDRIKIVQVISWNDYGESHYIGPIRGAQPNSEAWVNGFDHEAWLHLNSYFSTAFKTGVYPSISQDRVYMWARPHPRAAVAPDSVPRPKRWRLTDDYFWVIAFTTAPSTVELSSGATCNQFCVQAGASRLQQRLEKDKGMRVRIIRSNEVILDFTPDLYYFRSNPETYNFNAFVAMHPH